MLEVKVNQSSVRELNKNLDEVKKSLKDINDAKGVKKLNDNLEDVNKTTKTTIKTISTLEGTLKGLNDELENTEIGTKAYRELEKQVIATSGELKNLDLARESLDNEQFASEAKSVAGGLGDVAGGLALVGVSGGSVEQIVQTMAKVEGVTKLATGAIEAYSSGVKVVNSLAARAAKAQKAMSIATAVQTTATGAQTTATAGATTTQLGLNTAMLANPIFLLVAGIAALVAAFIIFGGEVETAEENNAKLNKTLEAQQILMDRTNDKRIRNAQNNIKLLQSEGASIEERFEAEFALIRVREQAQRDEKKRLLSDRNEKKKLRTLAIKEGNTELADEIHEEVTALSNKFEDLLLMDADFRNEKKVLRNDFNKLLKDEEEKDERDRLSKAQSAYRKRLAAQKSYNDDRLSAARRIKDLELSLLEDGISKDTQLSEEKTKRAIEDLEKQYGNVKYLNETQLTELNSLRALLTTEGNAEVIAINDEYYKEDLKNRAAFAEEIKKLLGTEGSTQKELLDMQYADDLTALQKKVDDEIFTIEEGNKIKAQLLQNLGTDKAKIDADLAAREKAAMLELNATDYEGKLAQLEANRLLELEQKDLTESELALIEKRYAEERKRLGQEEFDGKLAMAGEFAAAAGQALDMVADISSNIFETQNNKRATEHANELANLEEGSEEYEAAKARQLLADEKAAKKQFEINKKIQIAQAIIQGVQAVLAAYSSGSAIPVVGAVTGPLFAGLAAVAAATNIAKISSSTYQGGGGGAPSAPSAPSNISSSIQQAQPQFNLFGQGNDENTVGPGAEGGQQNITVNAEVSVSEINDVQNKVAVQEDRATL